MRRCDSLAHARALVAHDPLVSSGAMAATLGEWRLVRVGLRLVDPSLVVDGGRSSAPAPRAVGARGRPA